MKADGRLTNGTSSRLLHIAPEPIFASRFSQISGLQYTAGDLTGGTHGPIDITSLDSADDSFDAVYCCHVLEHIEDDITAMAEIRRVLAPDGWALLQVPITADHTHGDPNITDPAERHRVYGHPTHVRRYGPDFADRCRSAGLTVDVWDAERVVGPDLARVGVHGREQLFICSA